MRTQVVIIGGGPAGLLLSHLLHLEGIESVILERRTRQYVLSRIRAGVLEWGSVEILRQAGLSGRMDREGIVHQGSMVTWTGGDRFLIDTQKYAGRELMVYGQTQLTEDLYAARDAAGGTIIDEAADVMPHDVTTDTPWVTFEKNGETHRIDCDFVAGCDGYHGVSRTVIPDSVLRTYEKVYPTGWLGLLSETPPYEYLVYSRSERGFALCSMRNPMLSRYYVQVPLTDTLDDWSDDRFWTELKARYPSDIADAIVTGPSIEKSIAPLRSFVAEPMRYGNLFLAGDSAHIVPPTGAKGLNLAVSDAWYLSRGLASHFNAGSDDLLDAYSDTALRRVWASTRLSWWLTVLLHRFDDEDEIDRRLKISELEYIASSTNALASLAEQYAGLPL